MASNRKRVARNRISAGGITEVDYYYYTFGPFFEAENYEYGKTIDELKAFWEKHREVILTRYHQENRDPDSKPWPVLEWEGIQ